MYEDARGLGLGESFHALLAGHVRAVLDVVDEGLAAAQGLGDPRDAGGKVGEDVGIGGIVDFEGEDGEVWGECQAGSQEGKNVTLGTDKYQ